MNVAGVKVRLALKGSKPVCWHYEWTALPGHRLILHRPSHSIFEIGLNEDKKNEEKEPEFQFWARLFYVCARGEVLRFEDQVILGQEAILAFVWEQKIRDWMVVPA